MEWRKGLPSVPGFYWMRPRWRGYPASEPVEVKSPEYAGDETRVFVIGWDVDLDVPDNSEFYGPIFPPE